MLQIETRSKGFFRLYEESKVPVGVSHSKFPLVRIPPPVMTQRRKCIEIV